MTPNPHTIAIFGATGQTGRVVVRHLLSVKESAYLTLHIYARSVKKLVGLFPKVDLDPRVKIFEGSITDTDVLQSCCQGAEIIVCTLGENENRPVTVLEDAADGILASLQHLKASTRNWQKPKLFLLSSATLNARFSALRPRLVDWLIRTAFSHPYDDLTKAQTKYLESTSLLSVVLIQPPLLVVEEGSGHEISTDVVRLAVSYEDLGAAFAEMILDENYHSLPAVGVSSRLGDRPLRYAPIIFREVFWGMFAHVRLWFFSKKNTGK
ncbi:sterigmatocystin biosynthesis-like protein [Paraphaeosphaeria sporulosa]